MRIGIVATLLGFSLAACVSGPTPSDPFENGLDGARTPTFAMDSSWLRLGGAPPAPEAGVQAYADWLAHHPRVRALPAAKRAELLQHAPLVAARRSLHALGQSPRAVVDPLSLTAATSPTWSLATATPIDTTAAVLVAGASPDNANDRLVFEGADSPAHYIGVATNLYTASPTVVKSASIGSRIDGSAILTDIIGSAAYVVTSAGVVYAINTVDATTLWSASVGSAVSRSTPWLDFETNYLYVADLAGKVTAINTTDGSTVWSVDVTSGVPIHSSPLVMNGLVWVGADDGQMYRADKATGAVIGQPTKLCLGATCTSDDAIWSAIAGDDTTDNKRVLLGVNRRIIEIDASTASGCTLTTTTACGFTAYPIQSSDVIAPAGRFEGSIGIDFTNGRVYFGYANRLWRATWNAGITSAFQRATTDDPTGLLRGANPTSHGYPRAIPFAFNNTLFVGDGAGVLHRFDAGGTFAESAWKSFNGGAASGKDGPAIDSTALLDFLTGGNVYFGVKRPTSGEWDSLPQSFTSDAASTATATRLRLSATGFATAGNAVSVTVTALDASGLPTTNYTGTVRFVSSDAGAMLPGDYTFTAADAGRHTFSVTFAGTGSQLVGVLDTTSPTIAGADGFCVGTGPCGPVAVSDRSSYASGQAVVVLWAFLPGNRFDWVSVATDGSPASSFVQFASTNGWRSGTTTFTGLGGGTYRPRALLGTDTGTTSTLLNEGPAFTVAAGGSSTVTTDASSYPAGSAITVNWAGLPGNASDWIAVATAGSPDTSFVSFVFTTGAIAGSTQFTLPPGTYVARAFSNNTYNKLAESAPFTVTSSATVTTNKTSYLAGEAITVSWTGLQGSSTDWVSIVPQGAPATSVALWAYTGGAMSGSYTFAVTDSLTVGTPYVARVFNNNSYVVQAESASFTTTAPTSPPTVTTNQTTYVQGAPVTVSWTGMLPEQYAWIAIATPGSPDSAYVTFAFTNGATNSSTVFNLSPGTYVARAFRANNSTKVAESAQFVVQGGAIVTTDKTSYALGEAITVTWSGMQGNATDWISIVPAGEAPTSYTLWVYTGGATSGQYTFTNTTTLIQGRSYVARGYFNNNYTIQAESSPFPIN